MNKKSDDEEPLDLDANCTVGAGATSAKYTRSMAEARRSSMSEPVRAEGSSRPETGQMKFDGDWTGFFIRGDNALMEYAPALRWLLNNVPVHHPDRPPTINDIFSRKTAEHLMVMLERCDESHSKDNHDLQRMKPFLDCIK